MNTAGEEEKEIYQVNESNTKQNKTKQNKTTFKQEKRKEHRIK
jgi:hypothetical protein